MPFQFLDLMFFLKQRNMRILINGEREGPNDTREVGIKKLIDVGEDKGLLDTRVMHQVVISKFFIIVSSTLIRTTDRNSY